MFVIGVKNKPMKMAFKKLSVFQLPFALNIEHWGNFKGGCQPVNGDSKGTQCPCNLGVQ